MRKRISPLRPPRRCGDHLQITPLAVASTSRMLFKKMHHVSRFRETLESRLLKLQMPLAGGMLTGRAHWIWQSPTRVDFTCRTQDAGTRGRGSTSTDIACTILRLRRHWYFAIHRESIEPLGDLRSYGPTALTTLVSAHPTASPHHPITPSDFSGPSFEVQGNTTLNQCHLPAASPPDTIRWRQQQEAQPVASHLWARVRSGATGHRPR
jgi:hypothetical protein